MMSETNKQIVQQAYERFGAGDIPGVLALFSEDIQWLVPTIEHAAFSGPRSGKAAVTAFFGELMEAEDLTEFVPMEFIAEGDKVVVIGKSSATAKSTGRSFSIQWVHIFTLRDGKVAVFLEFFDNALASKAFQKAASA